MFSWLSPCVMIFKYRDLGMQQRCSRHSTDTVSELTRRSTTGNSEWRTFPRSLCGGKSGIRAHDPSDERRQIYQWATMSHRYGWLACKYVHMKDFISTVHPHWFIWHCLCLTGKLWFVALSYMTCQHTYIYRNASSWNDLRTYIHENWYLNMIATWRYQYLGGRIAAGNTLTHGTTDPSSLSVVPPCVVD